jgi:large subunit ribosomal protein L15e
MAEKKQKSEKQITSVNGMYHYMGQAWKKPTAAHTEEIRNQMISWRAGPRIAKLEKPTRLDRARILGYKAKKGFVIFRVTIERGGRKKARPTTKRRSKRFSIKRLLHMSYQWVAEQRVQKEYRNLEVLNSYKLGKDGRFYFFEVITVDRNSPEIKADPQLKFLTTPENKFRALRGLTSAAKKARGLTTKSRNMKVRPSLRSWHRQGR